MILLQTRIFKNSRSEVFYTKGVAKNFAKLAGKLFIKQDSGTGVFSVNFAKFCAPHKKKTAEYCDNNF